MTAVDFQTARNPAADARAFTGLRARRRNNEGAYGTGSLAVHRNAALSALRMMSSALSPGALASLTRRVISAGL